MSSATFVFAGHTDVGQVREHNEDSILLRPDMGLAVLADGMGGHNAGEVASKIAVETIADELARALQEAPLASGADDDGTEAVYLCMSAISQANTAIFQNASEHPQHRGMGTTVVLAMFAQDGVTIAHVGDSRAYLLRQGKFEQLTNDHSMVEEVVRQGLLTPEQAQRNFSKNLITRALGVDIDVDADVQQLDLRADDLILICSDGLTDMVSDADVALTLRENGANLDLAAQRLVDLANARGGADNVSVLLIRYHTSPGVIQTAELAHG